MGVVAGKSIPGRRLVVAWARESLSDPDGEYAEPELRPFLVAGKEVELPVARCWFDPSSRLSMDTFEAVAEGRLRGVSVEFVPLVERTVYPRLIHEGEPFTEVVCWSCHGWSFTHSPACRGAKVLSVG